MDQRKDAGSQLIICSIPYSDKSFIHVTQIIQVHSLGGGLEETLLWEIAIRSGVLSCQYWNWHLTTPPRTQCSLQTWALRTTILTHHRLSHIHVHAHTNCTHLVSITQHCSERSLSLWSICLVFHTCQYQAFIYFSLFFWFRSVFWLLIFLKSLRSLVYVVCTSPNYCLFPDSKFLPVILVIFTYCIIFIVYVILYSVCWKYYNKYQGLMYCTNATMPKKDTLCCISSGAFVYVIYKIKQVNGIIMLEKNCQTWSPKMNTLDITWTFLNEI